MRIKTKIVSCLSLMFLVVGQSLACTPIVQDMSPESIQERTQPLAMVNVSGDVPVEEAVVAAGPKDPAKTYKTYCTICHQVGVAGAPKFRDKASWGDRLDMGIDALTKSAIKGKGGMPPKGTCMQCTDEDIKAAVEYMLPQ